MKGKTEYYLDTRVLAILGIVAALPLAVGFYLIQESAKANVSKAIGEDLSRFAEYGAANVEQAVHREVLHVAELAAAPELDRAVAESNRRYESVANGLREMEALDAKWSDLPPNAEPVSSLLGSESSRFLARLVSMSPIYEGFLLIDGAGGLVAASDKPFRYSYRENPWFVSAIASAEGEGRLAVSRVRRFPAIEKDLLAVTMPIWAEGGEAIGVLRAFLCTECLFQGITSMRFGETGHALLVEKDGRILAGTVAECVLEERYRAADDSRRALQENRSYFVTGMSPRAQKENAELVGHEPVQLAASYPELDWLVMVEQPLLEAQAPLASLHRDILFYFLTMGVAVLLLALYFSFRLEKPVTDIEMDLHHEIATLKSRF